MCRGSGKNGGKEKEMSIVSRITKNTTVLEEANKRMDYIFKEFDNVVVAFSGGKDSTVTLELAIEAARRADRLPIKVMFIDQEGELENTVSYMRRIKERKDEIELYWYQIPIDINVSSNQTEKVLHCWGEEYRDVWIREKEPDSIHENVYCKPDTYFNDLFEAIALKDFAGNTAILGGVRAEEASKRLQGLTRGNVYKGITWGKTLKKGIISLYPLYDWTTPDIWKYIADKGCDYNKIYDLMYGIGLSTKDMRVSSLFHENSIGSFTYLAQIERENWNRITNRIIGANTVKTSMQLYKAPNELPYMFKTWKEYAIHLFNTIITEDMRPMYHKKITQFEIKAKEKAKKQKDESLMETFWVTVVNTLLRNDYVFTQIINFMVRPPKNT